MRLSKISKKEHWNEIEELKKQEKKLVYKVQEMQIGIGRLRSQLADLLSRDWIFKGEIW